jgi:fatty-acyl-CoA synthase
MIEEALLSHPAVAFAGAIGQPDASAGELPCAYVELVAGAGDAEGAGQHAGAHPRARRHAQACRDPARTAQDRGRQGLQARPAAHGHHPRLRRERKLDARVAEVVEEKKRGLVAKIERRGDVDEGKLREVLGNYAVPWDWK